MEPTAPTVTERTGPTATEPTERTLTAATPHRYEAGDGGLAGLLGPAEAAIFFQRYFGQDAYRTRMAPDAARRLFGWPQLNAALAEHRLNPPRLRLESAAADVTRTVFKERRTRRGAVLHDLDPTALNAQLRDGATLIVDAANELAAPLQQLCARLSNTFSASCQANMYACWGVTPGFDVHWDDHEVFVIQVEGRKRWALYGSTRAWPSRRDPQGEHPRPQTPIDEIVLEPGDILYLPRGYWHAAVGMGEPTLHLTVGVTRKSGADLLHWLADQALTEATVRADLPLEQSDEALGARVAELLALAARRDPQELGRLYRRHVQATLPQRPKMSFPFLGDEASLPADSQVALSDGPARLEAAQPGAVVLHWRGAAYTVDACLERPLERLARGETVPMFAFDEAAGAALRPLVSRFIAEMTGRGVFVLRPGARS